MPDTDFEAMIVSEGVRDVPVAHPPEFRRRALGLVAQGNPDAQTARDLRISESCLRNWMNRDAVDSGRDKAGSPPTSTRSSSSCGARTG
ncbi:helix-turn-helix domain-containing protein [Corynebacterium glyciniphilum]|uniref:helix-turn-helix domain-containing protein n=1 Tax=Corynebacterium glyciniphilum TaxID=1404244 RepID=UPI003FD485D6